MSNCSSSRNNLDFFLFRECCETKAPPSLICLGRVPLGGGSAWTERALPKDYGMRGGEMSECISVCVCVEVCTSVCDGHGGVVAVGGSGVGVGVERSCKQFYPKRCNCP